ncbi:MAG: hypothetical protein WA705_22325 [Candidatus Ozemobacteraceae bacterium]
MKLRTLPRILLVGVSIALCFLTGCGSGDSGSNSQPLGVDIVGENTIAAQIEGTPETTEAVDTNASTPTNVHAAYPWTHYDITDQAFEDAWNCVFVQLSPRPASPSKMKAALRNVIATANLKQDSGKASDDLRRHYNRMLISGESASSKLQADAEYAAYVRSEESTVTTEIAFGPKSTNRLAHANAALEAAGRVLHAYQDFYFHAIRRDGAGGSEFLLAKGFKAWTGNPVQVGDPTNRGNFYPCSWKSALKPGEHGYGEPVGTGTKEKTARFNAARQYCAAKLVIFIKAWWAAYGAIYF